MKSTKLATRALAGLMAVLITGLIIAGIDSLAISYGAGTQWSNSVMAGGVTESARRTA